tara:strand:- start:22187 stop:23485 length:1299 start_codon:yes stop_codon:yes gene_type:complete
MATSSLRKDETMKALSSSPPARRSFLKAAGITIALPMMESVATPAGKNDGGDAMRMVCISPTLGVYPKAFFPKSTGANFELTPTLKPLENLRGDFTVCSNMDHPAIFSGHGGISTFLTGIRGGNVVSMDQLAAEYAGYQTRFPSMHVAVGGGMNASWTSSGIRVRELGDPRDMFDQLFVPDSAAAIKERELRIQEQGSILDLVREQAKRFARRTNPADRQKLEEYLTAIRDAETKLQGMQRWANVPKPKVNYQPEGHPHSGQDYEFLAPMMFDLILLAIQSDSSRVFTAGFGMHNRMIELDGVSTGYHSLSHHGNRPDILRQLGIIDNFYIQQMARFVQKLKDSPLGNRGDGTLLDKTMVYFGSGMGDAARHSNRDLPVVLAGGGFRHQGHVDCKTSGGDATPLNNLYTTMLQKFGVEIESFNGATGTFSLS